VTSRARQQFVEEPSTSFSEFHRTLPRWYTQMDLDAVYYDVTRGHKPYLLLEVITVRNGDLTAPERTYELYDQQKKVRSLLNHLRSPNKLAWEIRMSTLMNSPIIQLPPTRVRVRPPPRLMLLKRKLKQCSKTSAKNPASTTSI